MSMQDISKNALRHLEKNCLMHDKSGGYSENAEGLFRRVSSAAASADARYDSDADTAETAAEFFELMTSMRFLPGSLTLLNAGRIDGQLASCFVLPVEDSMESIFDAVKNAALIYKSGGNIGFSFSSLRKSGDKVNGSHGEAGGPIGFMRVFGAASQAVKQENKQHGENLAVLRIDHPDIEKFIRCHEDESGLQNFQTAVIITDEFLQAAETAKSFKLIDPGTGTACKKLKANELFVRLVDVMRRTGAPIVLFDGAMKGAQAAAPCGEQPLMAYESSNIGSINLAKMLKRDGELYVVDYDSLRSSIASAVHFLDNIIDVNSYPFEKISHVTRLTRKIGLGVMGFADMLWYLGIPYNSDDAVELASSLMAFINAESHAASFDLAEKRGSYPTFSESLEENKLAMRNKTVTAIAPENTLSDICECAGGISPRKNVMQDGKLHPLLMEKLISAKVYSGALEQQIEENGGTLEDISIIPPEIKEVFVCENEIQPIYQLKLEAEFQKNTDGAVSCDITFAPNASAVDIADIFLRSHDMGCMLFKAKCLGEKQLPVQKPIKRLDFVTDTPRTAPEVASSTTERFRTPCGTLTVTASYDAQGICELYTHGCENCGCTAYFTASQRLADLALRSGVPPENVGAQLRGIKCEAAMRSPAMRGVSCPDAMAAVIDRAAALSRASQEVQSSQPAEELTVQEEDFTLTEDMSPEEMAREEALKAEETAAKKAQEALLRETAANAVPEEEADEDISQGIEDEANGQPADTDEEIYQTDEKPAEITSPFEPITREQIERHLALEENDAAEEKENPAAILPADVGFKPIILAPRNNSKAVGLETLRQISDKQEDTSDTVFEDAILFGDLPESLNGDPDDLEEEAVQQAPHTAFDDGEDDTETELSDMLENSFFDETDTSKLAQSIFESFAAIDSLDEETGDECAEDTVLGEELPLDIQIDDSSADEQTPDYSSDGGVCAVCGSSADIVGNKIVCPVCGFTRMKQ